MGDPVTTMIIVDVAMMAASMALTASQKFKGPRLSETEVSLSEYGTPIPRFWGRRRFECPIIWAEKLREKKKTSKGKAGKNSQYQYSGTWAVAIADHEIDAVTRIWLDRHLSYQSTGPGPVSVGSILGGFVQDFSGGGTVKLARGVNMRIYTGTETQEPDPRMEQWCEDRYGPDTCPAYRGVSYIVFQDIPLEKFGNRIPQISVEAVHTKADYYPYDILTEPLPLQRLVFSSDYSRLYSVDPDDSITVVDVPTRTPLLTFPTTNGDYITLGPNAIYGLSGDGLLQIGFDGGETVLTGTFEGPIASKPYYVGGFVCFVPNVGLNASHYYSNDPAIGVVQTARSFSPSAYFQDLDGNGWAVGLVAGEDKVGFALMPDGPEYIVDTTTTGEAFAMCNQDGKFLVWQEDNLFIVDPGTWVAGSTTSAPTGATDPQLPFRNIGPGAISLWLSNSEYDCSDGSLIRTVAFANWAVATSGETVYDPINHALIRGAGSDIAWLYLDRVANAGTTLQTVVDDVAGWCGLTGHDSDALTQTVEGYSVTQGSGKDMLAPLLDIHDVDPRPHDFQVQFVNRGSAPAATLQTADFARDGEESRYVASLTQDTDLPRKVTLTFADKDHDQQANTVIAQRPLDAVDAVREATIDLSTYASSPSEAQKFADRYHRRQWMGREKVSLALTAQQLSLEPADVRVLDLDGVTLKARLTKLTLSGGRLNTEWERDDPAVHTLGPGTGADMDGRDDEVIYIPGPTKGFVKDIPLISDADNDANPLLYYGAAPYSSAQNWPGAIIYKGDLDGEDFGEDWNAVASADGATWGYATDTLGDASAYLWDRGNSVNVSGNLTLATVTEADIEDDPSVNLALLGDELINFTTATLEADGSYTLSGFKRGRRGTEWATGTHAANEDFVLVSDLAEEGMGLSDVGTGLHFKAQTAGRSVDGAIPIDVAFTGATLKPYAPARIDWSTDGTDLIGTIIRRTRVGGSWTDDGVVPLSENSEAYEVDVLDTGTVVRTITVTGTNVFTYAAADLTADGFSLSDIPDVNVYQMSDAVGRGFALAA